MSDTATKRLRLAAERLSPTWADAPDPCPGCRNCRIAQATAELLRVNASRPHDFGPALQGWLIRADMAANALADEIIAP
jgi:hypothetical protein